MAFLSQSTPVWASDQLLTTSTSRVREAGRKDRVEVLGGRIQLVSPAGGGTSLLVDIPIQHG